MGLAKSGGNAASNVNLSKVDVDVNVKGNKFDVDTNVNTKNIDGSFTTSTKKFDPDDPGSWSKLDMSDPATRKSLVDSVKKMENDSFTSQFSDVITDSSFYKKNKGKLATMGITVAGAAGWFGVLLAMGYTPAEAWAEMTETVGEWVDAAAGAAGGAAAKVAGAMWDAFVLAVHNAVGYKYFDDVDGTDKALKSFFLFLVMYKILGIFGINLVTLPFKLVGMPFKLIGKKNKQI